MALGTASISQRSLRGIIFACAFSPVCAYTSAFLFLMRGVIGYLKCWTITQNVLRDFRKKIRLGANKH